MKLIVGLGNPGRQYQDCRHNIGSRVIRALSKNYRVILKRKARLLSLCAKIKIKDQEVILALPLTYMNLSGKAVASLVKNCEIDLNALLVVCDDLDLDLGRMRLRASGSSGGHRGLDSISKALGSLGFARLRLGIGRPPKGREPAAYVLSPFRRQEIPQVNEVVERALSCCQIWASAGINKGMNIFNRKD